MRIESIEKLERGKHKITTDNDLTFYLYYREIKGLGIEEDAVMSDEQWLKVVQILTVRGKKRVYHLLARQDYTAKKLQDKLKRDGYPEVIIQNVVNYFKEKGFVDDYAYVEKFYNSYKNSKGRRVIESKLRDKGIAVEVIRHFFDTLNEPDVEYNTSMALLNKKFGRMPKEDLNYEKMMRFLAYRGFGYEQCRQSIEKFKRCE